jgi:TolB-like protein/Tfp pilus assembly protein PilF
VDELLQRLKERKLVQWALAYLAGAFAFIQVFDIVGNRFGWPESVVRTTIIALAIGFFAVLIIAWYHGEKGAQRVSGTEILILALLLAIGGAALWQLAPKGKTEAEGNSPSEISDMHSIAVLPFVNMSDDKGNEYFSDGISEEILNVLARIPELHVAARTSSFSFKGEKKEVPEIARELKVRMVLEGSVRKQAERVRVTAQLVDASNGYHLWSETYDRELEDIFAIQDEIANAITEQLKVKLIATNPDLPAVSGTKDIQAYELYLQGIALWQERGEKNLRAAEQKFKEALARDPKFAKGWAGLAVVYNVLPSWSNASEPDLLTPARNAAEHALSFDPNLAEPYTVLANMANWELRDSASNALFERAVALAPSFAATYQWYGESLARQGQFDAAIAAGRKAVALSPKSLTARAALAFVLFSAGREEEAITTCELILRQDANYYYCDLLRFDIALVHRDFAVARTSLSAAAARLGPEAQRIANEQLDALEGKTEVQSIAQRVAGLDLASNDAASLTPLNAPDMILWFIAIARKDLAIGVFEQWARKMPDDAYAIVKDSHFLALTCDPSFLEAMRKLKVDEAHIASGCPKAAADR